MIKLFLATLLTAVGIFLFIGGLAYIVVDWLIKRWEPRD